MPNLAKYSPETRRKAWRKHRYMVHHAHCIVDCHPPHLNANNLLRVSQFKDDGNNYIKRICENLGLIINLANIMQNGGETKCFNNQFDVGRSPRLFLANRNFLEIERQNVLLAKRLVKVKGVLQTRPQAALQQKKDWVHIQREKSMAQFQVPAEIMKKYSNRVELPKDPAKVYQLFRPQIYLTLDLVGFREIGRLYIDLYTEAAPQIVCELVRTCLGRNPHAFTVKRLFPNLWIDFTVALSDKIRLTAADEGPNRIEYDKRALSHEMGRGILSFRTWYLDDLKPGPMEFSISFKATPLFDKERVCFGRVVSGLKTLDLLRDYGMTNGRPKTPLDISCCGTVL